MGRGKGNLPVTMRFRAPAGLKARFRRVTAKERRESGSNMSDMMRRVILAYVEKEEANEKSGG